MFLSQIAIYLLIFVTALLTLISPFIGLVGYFVLSFLRPQDIYWYALSESRLSYYLALVTILSFIFHYARRDKTVPRSNELLWFFVLFFFLVSNSYLLSDLEFKEHSLRYYVLLSKLMLMSVMTILIVEDIKQIKVLIVALIVCFGILAVRGNYQYFFEGLWFLEAPGQPGSEGRLDNNGFAMEFVMVMPLAFFLFFTERPLWFRWGSVGTIPFMIHAVILTYSRGGFLGMAAVLTNCILFLKNKKWAVLAGVLIFILVMRLQGELSRQRMKSLYEYEQDPSAMSRIESWKGGYEMMVRNPWNGVGVGNFEWYISEYNPVITQPRAAHNAFFHIGGEIGLLGFILYLGAIVIAFIRLSQIRRFYRPKILELPHYYYATALRTSLIGYVICAMFLSLNYLELFYFLVAVVAAFVNIYRRDRTQYESSTAT